MLCFSTKLEDMNECDAPESNNIGEHFASQSRSSDHVQTYLQRWQGPMCLIGELLKIEMKRPEVHA
jgi:hypothetical protein